MEKLFRKHHETFDETDCESILTFNLKLEELIESNANANDDFIFNNLRKQINYLNSDNNTEYFYLNDTTRGLLTTGSMLTYLIDNEDLMYKIINIGFYPTYKLLLDHYIQRNKHKHSHAKEFIQIIFSTLSNLTCTFDFIANENLKHGFIQIALDCLRHVEEIPELEYELDMYLSFYDSIIKFLSINSRCETISEDLRSLNAITIVKDAMKRFDRLLHNNKHAYELSIIFNVNLAIILAFIVKDDELNRMDFSREIISILIKKLEKIVNLSKNNTVKGNTIFYSSYNIGSRKIKFHASAVLSALHKLSVNDNVKELMNNEFNLLNLIIKLFNEGNNDEQEKASILICSLCFDNEIRHNIANNKALLRQIDDKISNSKNKHIVRTCRLINEMINRTLDKRVNDINASAAHHHHVMISCSLKNRDQCEKLNSILKCNGYRVWIETEEMFDYIHDEMPKGVENAFVVLVCYSEGYKSSNHCRLEAQYARDLDKPIIAVNLQDNYKPDGWLSELLEEKQDLNLSNKNFDEFDATVKELMKRINSIANSNDKSYDYNVSSAHGALKHVSNKNEIKSWAYKDIKNWLIKNELEEMLSLFEGYDGLLLLTLTDMKRKNYTGFCKKIDDELKKLGLYVHLRDQMKLFEIMDELLKD